PSSTGKVRRRPKKSRARGAKPLGGSSWSNCPFPPQADVEQIDKAVATVAVTVGPDGRARSARVVSDPGYGFGAMAKRCALGQRYRAALNFDGSPITATTPPIRVFFRR
ncbi:MAG: ferric siderophore ABC transporter substrate-binding protein, partial [Myxococcota bacterium]